MKPSYVGLKASEGAQLWENSLCCMTIIVTWDGGRLLASSMACISNLKCPQTRARCLLKPHGGQHTWAGSELDYGRPTILPACHLFLAGRGGIWELWLWGSFLSREAPGRSREEVSPGAYKYLPARRAEVSPPNWQAHAPHLTISKAYPGSSPPGGPWVSPSRPGQHQFQRSQGKGATTCNKSRSCGNPERFRVLEKSNQTTRKTKTAMSEDIWRNWNTDWL